MPITVCPNCSSAMSEVSRRSVFIDVCPSCRGVWLDGGELEKMLAASDRAAETHAAPRDHRYEDDRRDWSNSRRPPKRRENSLFEMFGDLFE